MDLPNGTHAPSDRLTAGESAGPESDDPLPDAGAWRRDTDTRLHGSDITRLREAARQSRDRIARRLAAAGFGVRACPTSMPGGTSTRH